MTNPLLLLSHAHDLVKMSYILGIDIGTSTIKAVLTDETGEIHQESFKSLSSRHVELKGVEGGDERRVDEILITLEACMNGLDPNSLQHVCAIGICGQMHGCVLWKNDAEFFISNHPTSLSCSNLITWLDRRCTKDFLSSLPKTHQPLPVSTGYGCATLAWLQAHQPGTIKRFDKSGTIMDMIVWGLCTMDGNGTESVVMSSQNATSWGYFDVDRLEWEIDILNAANFPIWILPRVTCVPSYAGMLPVSWHCIPQGTPVSVAMGDLQCSILATKPTSTDAILNVGSASQLGVIRPTKEEPQSTFTTLPPTVMEVPYFGKDKLIVAASLTGANAFTSLVETFQGWLEELGVTKDSLPPDSNLYARLIHLAEEKLDTSLGICVTLRGERHEPTLTGSVYNMKHGNLSLGDITSAMLRGIMENLQTMMPKELFQSLQINRLLGSGSALQRNTVLRQHAEAVFKVRLEIRDKADAPLGAALAAKNMLEAMNT